MTLFILTKSLTPGSFNVTTTDEPSFVKVYYELEQKHEIETVIVGQALNRKLLRAFLSNKGGNT